MSLLPPFSCPEYERVWRQFISSTIHELARAKDPIYSQIQMRTAESVPTTTYTMEDGATVKMPGTAVEMTFSISRQGAIAGDFSSIYLALDDAATQSLKQLMPHLFSQIGTLAETTGNTVNAGGRPISWDLILEMYEKLEILFDKDGKPSLPTIVTSMTDPDLGPMTSAQEQRFNEIIIRKRDEALARRSSRKLH